MENKLIQKLEKILANHFVQENVESITFALFIFSILTGIFNYALVISLILVTWMLKNLENLQFQNGISAN